MDLEDVWVHIFGFLDGCGYRNATLTCRKWYSLVETVHIWERIVASFMKGLTPEAQKWLPQNKELDRIRSNDDKLDQLTILKRTYRIMATGLIVINPTPENEVLETQQCLTLGTSHHTILRKNRIFVHIKDALEAAIRGDYIFLHKGHYFCDITITTPVHIFGAIEKRVQNNETVYLILSILTGSITWQNNQITNGTEDYNHSSNRQVSSITSCYLPYSSILNIKNYNVELSRLVLEGESTVQIGAGAYVKMWRCNLDKCTKSVEISEGFTCLDISDSFFGGENFQVQDLRLIIKTLRKSVYNPDVVIGCVNTVGFVSRMKKKELTECLLEENVINILEEIITVYKHSDSVLVPTIRTINKFLLCEDQDLIKRLTSINLVPVLEEMIDNHPDSFTLQEWIPICLWNLLNQPFSRAYFQDQRLYSHLLDNLEKLAKIQNIAFELISFLWHSAHHLPPIRSFIISSLPRVVKVLDEHKECEKLYKEVMGLIWNLPGVWPPGVGRAVLPYILRSFTLATSYSSVNTTLGGFLIVTRRCPKEEMEYLTRNNIISLLLEIKSRPYVEKEAEHRLWKAISLMGRNFQAQKYLADLVTKDRKLLQPPLTEIDKIKLVRALTIHEETDSRVCEILERIVVATANEEVFFYGMDALVHLISNEHLQHKREEFIKIGQLILKRAPNFKSRKVIDWLSWTEAHIKLSPRTAAFGMDPNRSAMIHISLDGTICRHEFSGAFGTAISSHFVKRGKWYYEIEPLTNGLFQVGWVNDKFKPEPEEGIGVGDDKNSWGVDLKKHTKWHLNDDGSVRLPYAKEVDADNSSGIIQCFLDLDNRTMSFGFNGKFLGVAFENFDIGNGIYAAISTNLENECCLNFGLNGPFRFENKIDSVEYSPFGLCINQDHNNVK